MGFLEKMARKRGKLLKGGEPDFDSIARTVLRDWQYGKIPYLTQPDENYESKENKRIEVANKRKEIEKKLNLSQDLDEIREKNLDNVGDYGNQESEDEYEDVEEETSREPNSQETSVPPKEPVSEMDIIKAKLAKARKAMNAGLLKRKAA